MADDAETDDDVPRRCILRTFFCPDILLGIAAVYKEVQPAAEKAADAAPEAPEFTLPGANESQQAPQGVEAAKPSALDNAISKLRNDGLVSNRTADAVIADPNAMQQLADKTGLDTRGMTASERRNAVKDAVRQVAGEGVPAALSEDGANSLIEDMGQAIAEDGQAFTSQNQTATNQSQTQQESQPTEVDPALTRAIQTVLGANPVDTQNQQEYNGARSQQVQSAIDRLNNGGSDAPSIDEIMSIPEIAAAERANDGPETITLPNRQAIQDAGYQQAIQKGSWDGQDYNGEIRHDKRMDIVIGLPGSGKSSVYTERLSQEHKSRVIDTDDFREYIPEYNGSNASMVHEEASLIRGKVFDTAMENGENILLSTIGANAEKLAAQIEGYKEYGYQVYLHLNELPNNKSLARAVGRYISMDGSLGRYVSPRLIAEYGDKPTQTYLYLTGQGGNNNGGLESNLRQSGGYGDRANPSADSTPQRQAADGAAEQLLSGYDWYNNDVAKGEPPKLIQTSDQHHNGGMNAPSGDVGQSRTVTNTGLKNDNKNVRDSYRQTLKDDPNAAEYLVKHNAETLETARGRVSSPEKVAAEYRNLTENGIQTPEDVATSTLLLDKIMESKEYSTEEKKAMCADIVQKRKEVGTRYGQTVQAFNIQDGTMAEAGSPATAVDSFRRKIDKMKPEESTWKQTDGGHDFETWKNQIKDEVDNIGIAVATVEDGDCSTMRDIIRQIARARKTTAWFGTSQKLTKAAEAVLGKLSFEDLKAVANTQIAAMADDFRARSKTEIIAGIRKQSMLTSLKTFARNITGNSFGGLMDSASDSTGGRMMDAILSKFTGQRTVGNDFKNAGTWMKAAKEAAQFASLCVELNIPIETDAAGSLASAYGDVGSGKYVGKTFRSTGSVAMRAMYAYQKYMSYALEVSDKIFEGGTNAAVSESLRNLQNANLTDDQISELSEFAANRRTFKDATWKDSNGETKGASLSRMSEAVKNGAGKYLGKPGEILAETAMPFPKVPANVAQTGIDYTVGIVKGAGEILSIMKDANDGKTIDAARQRQAVTDFGRGLTGVGMVALFASAAAMGAVKVNDPKDKDEKALAQAEGRNGAQINWNALMRGLSGESSDWQDGDIITSLDFLEPYNTQLYLGYELAQEDSVLDALIAYPGATIKSVFNAFMDSPMVTGLNDLVDLGKEVAEADTGEERVDALAGYAGDVASSFIPQIVRQTAQYTDGYYRDTRGDSSLEYAINNIIAGIPGLSKTLPVKYSGLGEPQKRGGFFETFVDPTATHVYHKNDITGYLEELSQRTDGDTSFIPDGQAPMTIHVNGESLKLDGTARETYQKTYGELVNSYYGSLINSDTFQNLSDEQKADALNRAKSYAAEHARAAVSDYTTDKPKITETVRNDILKDLVRSEFSDAFETMEPESLDQAYSMYKSLPYTQRQNFIRNTGGRIGYYITAKENGVKDETFVNLYATYKALGENTTIDNGDRAQEWSLTLEQAYKSGQISKAARDALKDDMKFYYQVPANTEKFDAMTESGIAPDNADRIIKGLDALTGTGSVDEETGKASVTNVDKWGYIASVNGLSDAERDNVMKLYIPDYNPNSKSPNKTELKYDYLRDLGYSAEEFVETYGVTQKYSKKADRISAWKALGYSEEEARMLYKLYGGKIDVTGYADSGTYYPILKPLALS